MGCHAGQILEALRLPAECELFGCDIDAEALELGSRMLPAAKFTMGRAEALPYEDLFFDFVFARSVITVTDIPVALRELHRVLAPKGKLWLSLHRWADCRVILGEAWPEHPVKTLAKGAYVLANSALFHSTGKLVRYPLNRARMMSFQTETRMRYELEKAGLTNIVVSRGKYLVIEAEKVSGSRQGDENLRSE